MGHAVEENPKCSLWKKYGSCEGQLSYEYEGDQYCVLHLPSKDKQVDFRKALDSKIDREDFDFRGVYFPEGTDFTDATFSKEADFRRATFSKGAHFFRATFNEEAHFSKAIFNEEADFRRATFSKGANFTEATFSATFKMAADFSEATFNEKADFRRATFKMAAHFHKATFTKEANFIGATFNRVGFIKATFSQVALFLGATFRREANFSSATFNDKADFFGATFNEEANFSAAIFRERAAFHKLETLPQTVFLFRDVMTEKPERISFYTTHLRPSCFINVDPQKFDFSDVEWFQLPDGKEVSLEDEIKVLEDRVLNLSRPESLRKLTKACRRLMNNAEENRDYPTANEFHYWSMEAQRKEGWSRLGPIATLYWALSGYGERPRRAFGVLVAMYAVFAVLYMLLPSSPFSIFSWSDVCEYLGCIGQAATYSLSALARLLPAEPKISPGLFQFLVTVEGILGPLQIALFLLAVRRKVMR